MQFIEFFLDLNVLRALLFDTLRELEGGNCTRARGEFDCENEQPSFQHHV